MEKTAPKNVRSYGEVLDVMDILFPDHIQLFIISDSLDEEEGCYEQAN